MITKPSKYLKLVIAVSQNTRDVLDWHKRHFGGSVSEYIPKKRPDTIIFQWKASGDDAVKFLELVIPFLLVKRVQAQDAVTAWTHRWDADTVDPIVEKWKSYHAERRRRIAESKANAL